MILMPLYTLHHSQADTVRMQNYKKKKYLWPSLFPKGLTIAESESPQLKIKTCQFDFGATFFFSHYISIPGVFFSASLGDGACHSAKNTFSI